MKLFARLSCLLSTGPHESEKRRKKIVHLIHLDGPGGGPKTVFSHVSYYSHFFDVQVLHGGLGYLSNNCSRLRVPHSRLPIDKFWKLPIGFLALIYHLLRISPDLLLLHGQWAGPLGAIVGKMSGVRRIIYVSQWPAIYTDWDLGRSIRNYLVEWIPCRFANAIIAISPGNFYQYQLRFPKFRHKLKFLPNSYDPLNIPSNEEAIAVRAKESWNPELCHIVSVGRLSTQKRVDWLLRSWEQIYTQAPNARLWIIGDGEEEPSLKKLSASLNLKNIEFLGSRPIAWRYIAAADIVAMTSMYEGHANIPLEAMSCGRCIVANRVDGVKESFSDGVEGYLVAPADIRTFADRLLTLIKDKRIRSLMGEAGLRRARTYSKGPVLRNYLSLIDEILRDDSPAKYP